MRHLLSLTGSNFVEPELITSYNMKNRKKRDTILFFIAVLLFHLILAIYHFGNGKNPDINYGVFPIVGFQEL